VGEVSAAGYTAQQLKVPSPPLCRRLSQIARVAVEVSTYRPFYIIGASTGPASTRMSIT